MSFWRNHSSFFSLVLYSHPPLPQHCVFSSSFFRYSTQFQPHSSKQCQSQETCSCKQPLQRTKVPAFFFFGVPIFVGILFLISKWGISGCFCTTGAGGCGAGCMGLCTGCWTCCTGCCGWGIWYLGPWGAAAIGGICCVRGAGVWTLAYTSGL